MRLEKRRTSHFCGISLEFRPKLFQMARTPFLEFTKKFFPATQNSSLRVFLELGRIYYLFFSTNYFSTPPGVRQNKKLLHTLRAGTVWRREWDSNPRGRDAQRLSCQSTNIQMGSRGRRFNHSAI